MKLIGYQILGQTIGIEITSWEDSMLSGNSAFQAIEDVDAIPTDYVDISSILNWDNFGGTAGLSNGQVKREIEKLEPADLDDLTEEEKEVYESQSINTDRFYKEKQISETTTNSDTIVYDTLEVDIVEGRYEMTTTFLYSINSISKSFRYNVKIDGSSIYGIDPMSIEINDTSNEQIITISKDIVLTTGIHTIELYYGSEGNSASTIYYSNIKLLKLI